MGRNFTPPFTERQQKAIALVPKFFASPSIVASIFIVQHVLRSPKRRDGVYHRILCLMSAHDFIYAVKAFVSTWPMPVDTPFVWGASGSTGTCVSAGFFGQGGALTSICYNGSLTLYFLLVVKFGLKESYIRSRWEFWLHSIPMAVGWSTAIAGIPLTLYNAFGWTCWINTYPLGCIDGETCERGDNAGIYRWVFFHAELWMIFAFCFIAMGIVYHEILQHEQKMQRYDFQLSQSNLRKNTLDSSSWRSKSETSTRQAKSTKFAVQATFYVVVFFFTWIFPMLQAIFSLSSGTLYYPLIMLSAILSSLQGFFNALIYLRPRYLRIRETNKDKSFCTKIALVLGGDDYSRRGGPNNFNIAPWRRSSNASNVAESPEYDPTPVDLQSNEQSLPMEERKAQVVKPEKIEGATVEDDYYME